MFSNFAIQGKWTRVLTRLLIVISWLGCALCQASGPLGVSCDLVEIYDGHYMGQVVPTPQQVTYFDQYVPLADRRGRALASIVVSPDAPRQVGIAAAELSAQVGYLQGAKPTERRFLLPVVAEGSPEAQSAKTVIWLKTAGPDLIKTYTQLRPEGYVLTTRSDGDRWQVTGLGVDARGTYYCAQSLLQLMTVRDGAVVLRKAEIVDWPAFRIRAHQLDGGFPSIESGRYMLKWCAKFKVNQQGFGQAWSGQKETLNWRQLTEQHQEQTKQFCQRASAIGAVLAAFYVHPHRRDPEYNIRISDPNDIDALVKLCNFALEHGAGGIMLRTDDVWPLAKVDWEKFGNFASAHAYMVKELHRRLRQRWPAIVFMYLPGLYCGHHIQRQDWGEDYFRQLGGQTPREVHVVWTGPFVRSVHIKPEEVDYMVELLGRAPLLWDNTVYAQRQDYRQTGCAHFFLDVFDPEFPADFAQRVPGITFNWCNKDPVWLIGGITTADYLWNPGAYNPGESLRRSLSIVGGPECVDDLLALRKVYYQIVDPILQHDWDKKHLEKDKVKPLPAFEVYTRQINSLLKRIARRCKNKAFVRELTKAVGRAHEMVANPDSQVCR